MAVQTAQEFIEVLRKSQLLTPSQLAQAEAAAGEFDAPSVIARRLVKQELITRWQAGQLLAGRSTFYLGKYRLIDLLGRGGMGSVFLGRHVTMNRPVALKVIARQLCQDQRALDRFLAEARAIAALDSPNIVQAYSVDCEGERYYIVMEYVEGYDLQRLVEEEGPLEYHRAADYIRQAAEGLSHAHQRQMVHCDIKPSNLLVNSQGVVKILDLGLARLTHTGQPDHRKTEERVLGSVDYLAPEQAVESPDLDGRADVYSLGCTLYFLLTGQPPYPRGTLSERILQHQTAERPDPRRLRANIPAELAAICRKMMAKAIQDRHRAANEVAQALIDWHTNASSAGSRLRPLPRARRLDEPDDISVLVPLDDDFSLADLGDDFGSVDRHGSYARVSPQPSAIEQFMRIMTASPWRILAVIFGLATVLLILIVMAIAARH